MNKKWWYCLGMLLILCGCQQPVYTLENWLNDAIEILSIDENIMDHWEKSFESEQLTAPLRCQQAAGVLFELLHESGENPLDAMTDLGYFSENQIKENQEISEKDGKSLLEKAKNDLVDRTFLENETELTLKQLIKPIDSEALLGQVEPGYYETDEGYYYVDEDGTISEVPLEDIIQELEIQTTFQPDLSEGVIFPEGTSFEASPSQMVKQSDLRVEPLRSQYFTFRVKGFKISGNIWKNGMDISVKKSDFYQMTLENQLSISQFSITADVSLNPFKDPHFLLRADYVLDDTLSVERSHKTKVHKQLLKAETLTELKTRLAGLLKGNNGAAEELELLRFSFPVPGSLTALSVDVVLSLDFKLNGEIGLSFKNAAQHGFQTIHGSLMKIQENSWEIEPYLDGNAEFACVLGLDLKLKKFLLADIFASCGIGAEGQSRVHYVNVNEKYVDEDKISVPAVVIEEELSDYQMSKEAFVDVCADIDVYWFVRLGVGADRRSLLNKIGFDYSFTPIKNDFSLLHIENRKIIEECTRNYQFEDPLPKIENHFQISDYQKILSPGESIELTIENAEEKEIEWSSSNVRIATVENGYVQAHREGMATIFAEDQSGHQSSCVIIVISEPVAQAGDDVNIRQMVSRLSVSKGMILNS